MTEHEWLCVPIKSALLKLANPILVASVAAMALDVWRFKVSVLITAPPKAAGVVPAATVAA